MVHAEKYSSLQINKLGTKFSVPRVSCIMPTRNRRRFVPQSILYFQKQDYPEKELIVLDDGEDTVEDIIPKDPRIHYICLNERISLGAKRNLACEMATGDLIAHWDDDDWMAPARLSEQVRQLLETNASICGMNSLFYYEPKAAKAWFYHYPDDRRTWLAGGTFLYHRTAWQSNSFPEIDVGEDTAFLWQFADESLHSIEATNIYVGLIHDCNTAPKFLDDPRWEQRPLDDISHLLVYDRDFYVALRNGSKFGANKTSCNKTQINLAAPFMVYDGYGSMAEHLAIGMKRDGADVNLVPLEIDLEGTSSEFLSMYQQAKPQNDGVVLYFCWPRNDFERFRAAPNLFVYTMWEGSRLPHGWVESLNKARVVIVPTRFVAKVCLDSGVTVPVEVVSQGIDPAIYHYIDRPERVGITTLMIGTVIGRKHILEGINAWKQAFSDDPSARLIIKSRFQYNNYTPDDCRIQFVDTNETTRGIAHWYEKADVLLALGNEGFGLPLVEGMATGLPVIALNSEGQSDICEDAPGYLLPVSPSRWEPCNDPPYGPGGIRGVPSVQVIVKHLHWVSKNRKKAKAMGLAASKWALQYRDLRKMAPGVLDVMERYVQPKRPLRRRDTLWVPSWGSPCGIAEYTTHLLEHTHGVQVSNIAPDLRAVRVLHVEHEHSLFNDAELLQAVNNAKGHQVPVVITEHAVDNLPHPWEHEADILVALTKFGVEKLQKKWPDKRVEHIPHGCPTWFPKRKATRGKTIGVFGFLQRHKGFWKLLDVLRQVSGTELLMCSHARDSSIEAEWDEASQHLPVRRFREYESSKSIADRLAAEADILVYWYDEVSSSSASGAIRIGLATGVPVLAAPVQWFDDVAEVTYQPNDLIDGVRFLLEDTKLCSQLSKSAKTFCYANSWEQTAHRYHQLWRDLEQN